MSVETVFRGDLQDVKRSRLGQAIAAVVLLSTFGVVAVVAVVSLQSSGIVTPPEFGAIMGVVGGIQTVLLPLVAILASYSAIIAERKQGTVRFLLGLPNSRTDVYLGKFASRAVWLVGPLCLGLALSGLVGALVFREPNLIGFLGFVAVTVIYALIFLGFGLTLSAVFSTNTRVTAGVIGVYVLFRAGFSAVQWMGLLVSRTPPDQFTRPYPPWYFAVGRANPMNAYPKAMSAFLFEEQNNPLITTPFEPIGTVATSPGYAVAALVVFLALAPLVGYVRFQNRDVL